MPSHFVTINRRNFSALQSRDKHRRSRAPAYRQYISATPATRPLLVCQSGFARRLIKFEKAFPPRGAEKSSGAEPFRHDILPDQRGIPPSIMYKQPGLGAAAALSDSASPAGGLEGEGRRDARIFQRHAPRGFRRGPLGRTQPAALIKGGRRGRGRPGLLTPSVRRGPEGSRD